MFQISEFFMNSRCKTVHIGNVKLKCFPHKPMLKNSVQSINLLKITPLIRSFSSDELAFLTQKLLKILDSSRSWGL